MVTQTDLAGNFTLPGTSVTLNRMGYGAMQLAGRDGNKLVWRPPRDVEAAIAVVRLPPSVHGEGDHGFVPRLIQVAREKGVSAYVGDGMNRWPSVHRLDAAGLFRLALEKGAGGAAYHGIADEGVPTREIAEAIGRRLVVPVMSKSGEVASEHFGWIGRFFAIDGPASSELTKQRLGWRPVEPGLIADLDQEHYFAAVEEAVVTQS